MKCKCYSAKKYDNAESFCLAYYRFELTFTYGISTKIHFTSTKALVFRVFDDMTSIAG